MVHINILIGNFIYHNFTHKNANQREYEPNETTLIKPNYVNNNFGSITRTVHKQGARSKPCH